VLTVLVAWGLRVGLPVVCAWTDFHPSILYLTGTKDQVSAITRAFRVYFSKVCADSESPLGEGPAVLTVSTVTITGQ
jgi:cytochrome oxidase Cu insertion factor (SCO1/SenC/PrrC family)